MGEGGRVKRCRNISGDVCEKVFLEFCERCVVWYAFEI
jgi:hypothetical protein